MGIEQKALSVNMRYTRQMALSPLLILHTGEKGEEKFEHVLKTTGDIGLRKKESSR